MRRPSAELVILVVVMGTFLALAIARERSRVAEQAHMGPSTFSYRSEGTRAFFELCSRRGVPVVRVLHDLSHIPPRTGAILLLEPLRNPMRKDERKALEAWVQEGGLLVVVAESTPFAENGYRPEGVEPVAIMAPPRNVAVQSDHGMLRDVRQLHAGSGPVLMLTSPKARAVISDPNGVLAASVPQGEGSVLVVSSALSPTNLLVGEADNAVFWMNVAELGAQSGRSVAFDEYHLTPPLRPEDRGRWWRALPAGVQAAAWLVALMVLGAIWVGNQRFGSIIEGPPPDEKPAETAGALYVTSMARLLRRARCPELAVEYIHHSLMRSLARRFGLEVTEVEGKLGTALTGAEGLAGRLAEVIAHGRTVVQGGRTSEQKLLSYAQEVWTLRKELGVDR